MKRRSRFLINGSDFFSSVSSRLWLFLFFDLAIFPAKTDLGSKAQSRVALKISSTSY